MAKRPLPLNPSPLPDLPPLPPSEPSKPPSPLDQPPVKPLVPIPWNIHCREYSSMETYQEPPPVENPLEDPDSPMEDVPLEPEPVTCYEPDVPGGQTHTLSLEESPIEPWEAYLTQPSSPVSRKHSLSPTSPSSAPIRQCTSHEGSYQSITPSASSPIAGTSCYDPGPLPQFSAIFHHFISRSQSLVPYSFPHAPLGPSPNHLTSHLMDHMTNPQSTITCHHSAVRSIMTCPYLTLFGLPAHDAPLRSCQLMMELYLELPRHDLP